MKKIVALVLASLMILSAVSALAATGIGMVTTVSTTPATAEKAGSVSVNTTVCALTVDENGVITGIRFDVVQPKASFDAAGAVVGDATSAPISKSYLKDDYGMRGASSIGKEWFEQAEHFEKWCLGKTVADVLATETAEKNASHKNVPVDPDILSGCTIDIGAFKTALQLAADNAR